MIKIQSVYQQVRVWPIHQSSNLVFKAFDYQDHIYYHQFMAFALPDILGLLVPKLEHEMQMFEELDY